jgi:hypothetical protein
VQAAVADSANIVSDPPVEIGLRSGASADQVLEQAIDDDAPFARSDELRAWVAQGLHELASRPG